jgi:hypothetical protein
MELIVSQVQGRVPITVLRIVGRINLGNNIELEKKGEEIFRSGGRFLIIDLSETESLTSAGLRAIINIYRLFGKSPEEGSVQGKKGVSEHVKLAKPTAQMRYVLTVAGFQTFLEIHESLEAAIASF